MNAAEGYTVHKARPAAMAAALLALCAASAGASWYVATTTYLPQEEPIYVTPVEAGENPDLEQQVAAMGEAYGLLRQENEYLLEERAALDEKLTQLEQTAKIDKQSISDVRDQMVSLQDQLFGLRRELEFYRSIMDTTQTATGLQIQGWYTRHAGADNQHRYKIVLTNLSNKAKDTTGVLRGKIRGSDAEGKEKELTLRTVSDTEFSFKFRNFKVFEGHVQLPGGFEPRRVSITLTSRDGKKTLAEKEFSWVASNN